MEYVRELSGLSGRIYVSVTLALLKTDRQVASHSIITLKLELPAIPTSSP